MRAIGTAVLLMAAVCFTFGYGCAGSRGKAPENGTMSDIVIEKGQKDKVFQANRGDRVIIRLPENPTTGYRWQVEAKGPHALEPLSSSFLPYGDPAVGRGGIRTFVFKVRACGDAPLQFALQRSWEPKQNAIDHFAVTIEACGKGPRH
jgi:predicted secreted protein